MNQYSAVWQDIAANRRFELERLVDSAGELVIQLSGHAGETVVIRFDSHVCYRRMDEGDALVAVGELAATAGTAKSFYRVEASEFLSWFHAQSQGIYRDRGLQHFAVCTANDIIDVIAFGAPRVEAKP